MGWMEIKAKYQAGASATEQHVEDVVARRVLRGLGLVEREFPPLELAVFGECKKDEPLWSRVAPLLNLALRKRRLHGFRIETLAATGQHKDVVARLQSAFDEDGVCGDVVYLTRIGKTKKALAYFVTSSEDADSGITLTQLVPPFSAIALVSNQLVITQDIETFIQQFGPYEWKTYTQDG